MEWASGSQLWEDWEEIFTYFNQASNEFQLYLWGLEKKFDGKSVSDFSQMLFILTFTKHTRCRSSIIKTNSTAS